MRRMLKISAATPIDSYYCAMCWQPVLCGETVYWCDKVSDSELLSPEKDAKEEKKKKKKWRNIWWRRKRRQQRRKKRQQKQLEIELLAKEEGKDTAP